MEDEVEAARDLVRDELELDYDRPRIRADCEPCPVCQAARDARRDVDPTTRLACGHGGDEILMHSRPCVYVGCRHSAFLEVSDVGSIHLLHADNEPEEMPADMSCSLDVSQWGDRTLDLVGRVSGVSRERARQLEVLAKRHLAAGLRASRIRDADGFDHPEGFTEPPSE